MPVVLTVEDARPRPVPCGSRLRETDWLLSQVVRNDGGMIQLRAGQGDTTHVGSEIESAAGGMSAAADQHVAIVQKGGRVIVAVDRHVAGSRRTYCIAFAPVKKGCCIHIGGDESNDCEPTAWKGEVWIDAEDLQPARIITELAYRIPWGVRVFLGTNLQQTGFSITYYRAGENVWFPATYGTEFRLNVLWGYRRTIALSMESSGFQKTNASSTIEYDLPKQ